jgi:hypothetical protein
MPIMPPSQLPRQLRPESTQTSTQNGNRAMIADIAAALAVLFAAASFIFALGAAIYVRKAKDAYDHIRRPGQSNDH